MSIAVYRPSTVQTTDNSKYHWPWQASMHSHYSLSSIHCSIRTRFSHTQKHEPFCSSLLLHSQSLHLLPLSITKFPLGSTEAHVSFIQWSGPVTIPSTIPSPILEMCWVFPEERTIITDDKLVDQRKFLSPFGLDPMCKSNTQEADPLILLSVPSTKNMVQSLEGEVKRFEVPSPKFVFSILMHLSWCLNLQIS